MVRAGTLTAAQCATYDELKGLFISRFDWRDGITTHLTVSALAGLVTTTVTGPFDMVKTRMFVGDGGSIGLVECCRGIYREQGVKGFFRGWGANW